MDINSNIATMLCELRHRHGLSIKKMADLLYIDDHTWSRYETGKTSPTIADLVMIFRALGENPFPYVLNAIYPQTYDFHATNNRAAVVDFFEHVASDRDIEQMTYLIQTPHGSNPSAQLAMFAMIDHLPLRSRVVIAELVDALWQLADVRGELIGQDVSEPDVETFRRGLRSSIDAVASRKESYIIEKEV